ncbi:2-oxoglutarate and iron-dependent oxygenase domain-containing protein CP2 [Linum perenne]
MALPTGNGNGAPFPVQMTNRLRLSPNSDHKPDVYDDLQLEYSPLLFSSLERYLPPAMLNLSRDTKVQFMKEILVRYFPEAERTRIQKQRLYRQKIMSDYEPLSKELYSLDAAKFFVPSFLEAVKVGTEESIKSIVLETTPGVYSFDMLQPSFCDMLISEVENIERWVHDTEFKMMRPNTMNKYGAVLDDFGLDPMLAKLMDGYVQPMAKVFFPEINRLALDSHHGFIVEYGADKDVELGFHVDDSEVTLNVCLGKDFFGGQLYFRGARCDKHVNTKTHQEEIGDYAHIPGRAVLHRGRHRHGARATTSGQRFNLIMWCRSSAYREMKKYKTDFSTWCGECLRRKKERQRMTIASTKMVTGTAEAGWYFFYIMRPRERASSARVLK